MAAGSTQIFPIAEYKAKPPMRAPSGNEGII